MFILFRLFALFTTGIEQFEEYYKKGLFDKVYATNVSYVPKEIKDKPWFEDVDCSYKIGHLIMAIVLFFKKIILNNVLINLT